jgi:hypothetical protein
MQLKMEHAMPVSPWPHAPETREHLPCPLLSPRCVQTRAPTGRRPAPGSVTHRQPTQNRIPNEPR